MADNSNALGLIYGIIDPRYGVVRYVGWAQYTVRKNGKYVTLNDHQTRDRRFDRHIKEAKKQKSRPTHKVNMLRSILASGFLPMPIIIERNVVIERERFWIPIYRKECLKAGTELTNGTDGGECGHMTEDVIKKLRKPKSEEGRQRMKEAANTPEALKRRSEINKIVQNRPEVKKAKSEKWAAKRKQIIREIRKCACGCGETFECESRSKRRYIRGHNSCGRRGGRGFGWHHSEQTRAKMQHPNDPKTKGSKAGKNNGFYKPEVHIIETRECACGCGETFECEARSKKRFLNNGHHNRKMKDD